MNTEASGPNTCLSLDQVESKKKDDLGEGRTHDLEINSLTP